MKTPKMETILLTVCGALLFATVGCGKSSKEVATEMKQLTDELEARNRRMEKDLRVKLARDYYGDAFALQLQYCQDYPPKNPKNQKTCAEMAKKIDAMEKNSTKKLRIGDA